MAVIRNQGQKNVTTIPATLQRYTSAPITEQQDRKRKVAAYARVSTDHEEQQTSYEAQIDYYTTYIQSRDDWEFVGMYSDEGITGTSTKRREGFKQMVADALDGKIELIITKSVSRFARNTVDSLTTIRRLKEHGVECYFEKENIWTFDSKGELLITIMSSLAQEESRSISENTLWGMRKSFQDGKAFVPFKHFLGYDRGPNGELVVNEEQAKTVRLIYKLYLDGYSFYAIAQELTGRGIKTPYGYDVWNGSTIRSILKNEKYKGDALLQKRYTEDFLSKKMRVNMGEVPQYYVEENHEAIIDPQVFELVQAEMLRRSGIAEKYSGVSIYSTKIQCGECGGWYGSTVWHSTDKYRRVVWRCNDKYKVKGHKNCSTPHLTEFMIQEAFLSAMNQMISEKEEILQNIEEMRILLCDNSNLEREQEELLHEMEVIASMTQDVVMENARIALDQRTYLERYNRLADRYDKAKSKYDEITDTIKQRQARSTQMSCFVEELKKLPGTIQVFDEGMWSSLVDHMTVYKKDDVRVTFKDGTEIKA